MVLGTNAKIPLTARRTNRSVLEQIRPPFTFEALRIKQKLSQFGHIMREKIKSGEVNYPGYG